MKILALDPGYDRCGIALIKRTEEGRDVLLDSMCIRTDKTMVFEKRIFEIAKVFREWIQNHSPDVCVLETLFFTTNQKTAMHVAEARGALLLVATEAGIPIHEFTPKQVKVAVTGDGNASKEQVMCMVPKLIPVEKNIAYDDEYDAIAVGITASAVFSSLATFKKNYPH